MGCDIHSHLEYKENDKYKCIEFYDIDEYYDGEDGSSPLVACETFCDRNYTLFGVLAGVRAYGYNECIEKPRGVPSDVSEETQRAIDSWGSDGHSHSYFSLSELIQSSVRFNVLKPLIYRITKQFNDFYELNRDLTKEEKQNIRFVFWFDN